MSNLEDVLQEKYSMLRQDIGTRFASMMEGYGHMVNILDMVEDYYKDCKRTVKGFVPRCSEETLETTSIDLNSMMNQALVLANAALTMAALAKLYKDTVVSMTGGDLMDMIGDEVEKDDE